MHSLVRFSKRTTEHRLPSSPTSGSPHGRSSRDLVCPVARSPTEFRLYFSSLLGILFSVRSRYLFAIGLEECLAFPVDARDVHEEYPIPASLELTHVVLRSDTGLSPCIALRFRRLLGTGRTLMVSPAPHVLADSVWAGPRSLAVTNGIAVCVLFLLLLRCFNSERSPLREAIARGFPFGDPQFFPSMQVPEAYRSLARPSSALEPSHSPAGTVASLMDVTLVTRITVGSSGRLDRTYIRCHHALVDASAFDPSHPRLRGMVHRSCVTQSNAVLHLRSAIRACE